MGWVVCGLQRALRDHSKEKRKENKKRERRKGRADTPAAIKQEKIWKREVSKLLLDVL